MTAYFCSASNYQKEWKFLSRYMMEYAEHTKLKRRWDGWFEGTRIIGLRYRKIVKNMHRCAQVPEK